MNSSNGSTENVNHKNSHGRVVIPSATPSPEVDIVREGEVITSIRVTCVCGCEVELNCEYSK